MNHLLLELLVGGDGRVERGLVGVVRVERHELGRGAVHVHARVLRADLAREGRLALAHALGADGLLVREVEELGPEELGLAGREDVDEVAGPLPELDPRRGPLAHHRHELLELREVLLRVHGEQRDLRGAARVEVGLGRGLEAVDMPVVRSVVKNAARQNYAMHSIILGIVQSSPFQMRTKLPAPGAVPTTQTAAKE